MFKREKYCKIEIQNFRFHILQPHMELSLSQHKICLQFKLLLYSVREDTSQLC